MIVSLLLVGVGIVLPWLAAFCFLRRLNLFPAVTERRAVRGLIIFLAFALSNCVQGLGYFLWLRGCGRVGYGYFGVEFLLAAGVILWTFRHRQAASANSNAVSLPVENSAATNAPRWLKRSYLALCVLAPLTFLTFADATPFGKWDAWKTWNLRAKLLLTSSEQLNTFLGQLGLGDAPSYPLFLPTLIARAWFLSGGTPHLLPWLIQALFALGCVGLLTCGVQILRGQRAGLEAGILLLATAHFFGKIGAATQYADVPLAFWFLLTLVLFSLREKSARPNWCLFFAGLATGAAAWTKNEGLLFTVVIFFTQTVFSLRQGSLRSWGKDMLILASGALPFLAVDIWFKSTLPATVYLFQTAKTPLLERITDLSRVSIIAKALSKELVNLGGGMLLLTVGYLIFVAGDDFFMRRRNNREGQRKESRRGWDTATIRAYLVCGLMFTGYLGVYLMTPADLKWQLDATLPRLLLQLWVLYLLAFSLRLGQGGGDTA